MYLSCNLFTGAQIDFQGPSKKTALMLALEQDHTDIMRLLLEAGLGTNNPELVHITST